MFLTDRISPLLAGRGRARALDTWRDTARLVSTRWEAFLGADREVRACAFASYVAALDGEEAAAAGMAGILSSTAKAA